MKEHVAIISENKSLEICRRIYDDIILRINDKAEPYDKLNNDLFAGHWGKLLYLFYYERYCDNNKSNAISYLEALYNNLDTTSINFTFCSGLTGSFWLLNHLHKNEFVNLDMNEIVADFIDLAIEHNENYLQAGNFDFLHGGSGICNLLIEFADRENVKEHLAFFVKKLQQVSVETDFGLSFPLYHYHTDPPSEIGINAFSLAHGICSYQIVLLKIYRLGIEQDVCKQMIEQSMQFMLYHETNEIQKGNSLFPSFLDGSKISSRVSWCYGDLNVATVLWQCGKCFKNIEWCEKAIAIYSHNTSRNTCETARVIDTCLCHGTAGNALMYLRIWENTGVLQFKNCAQDWYRLTYEMIEFSPDGLGIKMWAGKDNGWKYPWGLLEGSVGVGLSLISEYINKPLPWDSLLLIS